jgi:uncharacterized protein involved in exopolysaccharide biosynthesis
MINQSATAAPTLDLRQVVAAALAHRRSVIRWTIGVPAIIVGALLLSPRTWVANAAFLPQGRRPPGNLSTLAAQLGVMMPTGAEAAQSPAFYSDLIRTRVILRDVVAEKYPHPDTGELVTLADALGVNRRRDSVWRTDASIRELQQRISATASPRTGVVSFSVETESAPLSQALAESILRAVARFNLEVRQSQANAERKFTQQRMAESKQELAEAESALEAFDRANRSTLSPSTIRERERLTREVNLRMQVYTTLAQAFEQAKIEEVRDTPVFTIIEPPVLPIRPTPRGTTFRGLFGVVLGLAIGLTLAMMRANREAARASPGVLPDVGHLWADTVSDLRRPWRLVLSTESHGKLKSTPVS